MTPRAESALLEVDHLVKHFPLRRGLFSRVHAWVRAVDDVSFDLHAGETLGLVGESGSGKTTLGRSVLLLEEPTSGKLCFDGVDLISLRPSALRRTRRRMQFIFQDPYGSLNPRMRVESIVGEGMRIHSLARGAELRRRVAEILDQVGLPPSAMSRYPHEFSGGQRQRIGIARALSVDPSLIVCDEPVSALDVSVQAQVLNLLMEIRARRRLSYLFISHDLSVVRHISHRVAVMYLGQIVESGGVDELFSQPRHPYTQALLSAVPTRDPERKRLRILLPGEPPSPTDPPKGCRFHPRCPVAEKLCAVEEPPWKQRSATHSYRCIH